ncbi:hypothetical protein D3C80_1076260 [compost metagenome]
MLDKRGAVPAAVFVERCGAVDPVFVPVATEHQAVALVKRQIVLPVDRVAVSIENTALIAELVESCLAVFAVTEFDAGFPYIIDLCINVAADAAHIEVVVGLLLIGLVRHVIVTAERTIKLALATVIQQVGADFDVFRQGVTQAQAEGFVAVGVVIAITGIRLVGAIDPGGFIEAGAEVEAGSLITTGQAKAALPGLITAKTGVHARLQALFTAAAGEDLDHPANRIAAVNHRAGAAQHFHALDLFDIDVLQVAVAGGRTADALAIHQHQALGRLGAADVDPRNAAAPAGLRDLHTRYPTQQVSDAIGLQAIDVVAGEHGVGGAAVIARFDLAVGADQHVGQLQGLVAFEGVGQGVGGGQQKKRQGEAGKLHG